MAAAYTTRMRVLETGKAVFTLCESSFVSFGVISCIIVPSWLAVVWESLRTQAVSSNDKKKKKESPPRLYVTDTHCELNFLRLYQSCYSFAGNVIDVVCIRLHFI